MELRLPGLVLVMAAAAACGRIDFAATPDAVDPAALDDDGDGVLNGVDDCPARGDPLQHDEDGDGIGDACDTCPHVVSTAADTDLDGVADACDPSAGPQNRLVAFESFAAPPQGWEVIAPNATPWSFTGDTARIALVSDNVGMITIPDPGGDVAIDTELIVDAVSANGGNPARNFAIIDNYDTATDTGLWFGMVYDYSLSPPATVNILQVTNGVGAGNFASTDADAVIHIGVPYHLHYARRGQIRDHEVDGEEGMFPQTATRPDSGGRLGIRTRGLTVRFRYVAVLN